MLVLDLKKIGNKLYEIRTKQLLSRLEVAERAGLSDRTYANIERGSVNMRIETVLKICQALNITPNDIFVIEDNREKTGDEIIKELQTCTDAERKTAQKLLGIYLDSLCK